MTTTPDVFSDVGDAELISAVRGGDTTAYATLYERHVDAARRLARQLVTPADAEDLVAEAFTKMLVVLQRGGGPDVAFRAYLLTSVRRLHVDKLRAGAKVHSTDDLTPFEPGIPFVDTAVEGFDNLAAAQAFRSLPERWQVVLWHTEVEGQKPADIAPLLGMTPNSVAALAYRAREGLRQAFLSQHAAEIEDDGCRWTQQQLGGFVREGLSRRDSTKVQTHLDECRRCMGIYLELVEVNSGLAALLAPLLLGGTLGAAYLTTVGTGAVVGAATGVFTSIGKGFGAGVDRAKDFVAANMGVSVAASVAAVAAAAGLSVAAAQVIGGAGPSAARDTAGQNTSAGVVPGPPIAPAEAPDGEQPAAAVPVVVTTTPPDADLAPAVVPSATPTESAPAQPHETASPRPSERPTQRPSDRPSQTPTSAPSERPSQRPSEKPSVSPTSTPTATATSSPTTTPTPTETATSTPTSTPSADPRMSLSRGRPYYVNAVLAGLPEGSSATVTITASFYMSGSDARCGGLFVKAAGKTLTCTVTDDAPIVINTIGTRNGVIRASAAVDHIVGDDPDNNSAQFKVDN